MAEPKTRCPICGVEFLQATAARTGGICMKCKKAVELEARLAQMPIYQPAQPLTPWQLDELIRTATPTELIDALFDPACDKVNFSPDQMTEGDIIVYTVCTYHGETLNGGFRQYLVNQSRLWAHRCGESLRRIGAEKYAAPIEKCIATFTKKRTPEAWEADLQRYLDEHDEPFEEIEAPFWELYRADKNELMNLLADYIAKHPDVFATR
ncbi:MAG: DUF4375 domain-containing protein [Pirellulales bacterium]